MDASGMITEVRYILDEPSAVSWSDAELLSYINQAQQTIASMINAYDADHFVKSAYMTTVANTATVALPTDFISAKRIEWINGDTTLKSPEPLYPMPWQDRGLGWPIYLVNSNSGGRPYYYHFQAGNVMLQPVPDSAKTNAMRIWYVYRLADLVTSPTATTSEIPVQWHKTVVLMAALQAMRKMEQDTTVYKEELQAQLGLLKTEMEARQAQEPMFIRDTWVD